MEATTINNLIVWLKLLKNDCGGYAPTSKNYGGHYMQMWKLIGVFSLLLGCVENSSLDRKVTALTDLENSPSILEIRKDLVITDQADLDKLLYGHTEIHVFGDLFIQGPGPFDFKDRPFSYTGYNTKCKKSVEGSDPFIFVIGSATISNLKVKKSSSDGIDILPHSNVKFVNLDIQHACDEGITVRNRAKLELIDSKIVSYYNKGIIFYSNTEAKISNSIISSEQAFSQSSWSRGLSILVENSIIRKHPRAKDGRLITGDNCGDVHIKIRKTSLQSMQQLIGTYKCNNIKIEYI